MADIETKTLFETILETVKKGTAEIETIKSVIGKDAKGKDAIIDGEWKISGYTFKYSIPEGKKYGKSMVEKEGSDVAVDTFGIDELIMCIVYYLRHPKVKLTTKKAEKSVKEKKTKKVEKVETPVETNTNKEA